jgi:hypothetical protein
MAAASGGGREREGKRVKKDVGSPRSGSRFRVHTKERDARAVFYGKKWLFGIPAFLAQPSRRVWRGSRMA